MGTTTENPNFRISPQSKAISGELAKREGKPMQAVLDDAIDHYQRESFTNEANAAYARLQADPEAWQEELEERRAWDVAQSDGLKAL